MRASGSAGSSKRCITESDSIPRYDISHRKSSSNTARLAEVTALMEAMENQRTVYHRSHRPWKSLRDYHTPAARRLLIHSEASTMPRVSPINRRPACLSSGVQSSLSPPLSVTAFVKGAPPIDTSDRMNVVDAKDA